MRKLTLVAGVLALTASVATFAGPHYMGGPQGFNNQFNTVAAVIDNAYDDQYVTLTGRLTRYLGHDRYEFTDNTGRIEVELDDDRNWSHIGKDQLITIFGEVDRDFISLKIDVKDAYPAAANIPAPRVPR